MFTTIGHFVTRRARAILAASVVILVLFVVLAIGAFGRLLNNGFDDPKSGAEQAKTLLEQRFGGAPNVLFVVHARTGTVQSRAVTRDGEALVNRLQHDSRFTQVASYWTTHVNALKSRNSQYALILATVPGSDEQAGKKASGIINDYSHIDTSAISVSLGGSVGTDVGSQVGKDIARAESVAVPVTILLLILVFGSLVSALLPLAVGLFGIFGALALLNGVSRFADVSIFSINLITGMGLGLSIDYALLTVSRFREELASGASVDEAVVRTISTAGRTIAFSALTVAVAMAAMLVFPVYFLKSFAYGGIGVTLFASLSALFVLPSLLVVLGPKVNAGRVPWIKGNRTESRMWGRLATVVMKRPALTALPVVGALLVLALPIGHISFLPPDERVLPKSAPAHEAGDILRSQFATQPNAVEIVLTNTAPTKQLTTYATTLSKLPGAQLVASSAGSFVLGSAVPPPIPPQSLAANGSQRLRLFSALQPQSNAAQQLVKDVRATSPPAGTTAYVGGYSAEVIDSKHSIGSRLWLAGLLIVITCLILLFLFTGSVWQPIRALIGNAFTLAATFGVMVWIFQDGHLSSLLNFTAAPTDTDMPVLLFCVAFGLSMDYEVFLISRIKELHDHGATNQVAVVTGLSRTGRIVSMAATLLAVSFFAFGTSHVSFIQFFGLGSGMAILIDATLVRGVLVPAFQRVFGERSWYAPRPLRKIYTRFGFHEAPSALASTQ